MTENNFSSVLTLTSIDDFISPSQECIKAPLETNQENSSTGSKIKIEEGGNEKSNTAVEETTKRAAISLSDCLACSGCVTSAETVLISQQSYVEIFKILEENEIAAKSGLKCKYVVLSLSVQPVLSLAERYQLSAEDTALKIAGFFKEKGVHAVHTITVAEEIASNEIASEFLRRYRRKESGDNTSLPMLASACPGWICYAEKTHEFVLPYVSVTKSPQQITGSVIKAYYAKENGIEPKDIYHITLMPCFDKKLESSRTDFYDSRTNAKDVDCVITAVEMEQLLQNEGVNLADVNPRLFDTFKNLDTSIQSNLFVRAGSTSGGYAHHVLTNAASRLFSLDVVEPDFKASCKNRDLKECRVSCEYGTINVAVVNGFRNVRNLIQKLKSGRCPYDYVEIMACPSGCINGSAQLKPLAGANSKELIRKLENTYCRLPKLIDTNRAVASELYETWLKTLLGENGEDVLRTSYRGLKSTIAPLNIKW